jgi:pSer/pThr/pTyr-binding forkhead associated (FHA) protein
MITLVMRRGPTPGAVYTLDDQEVTIGRGIRNRIVIDYIGVSREHCRLVLHDMDYELHDLRSQDGTFVDGQPVVSPVMLHRGALIELGESVTLQYGISDSQVFTPPDYVRQLVPDGSLPSYGDTGGIDEPVAAPARYTLEMLQGPAVGYRYAIEGETIRIGRDYSNDVVIQDPEVSRNHLLLTRDRAGFIAQDLNSTNGSFINDIRLHNDARPFATNDVLRLGSMVRLKLIRLEDELPLDAAVRAAPYIAPDETVHEISSLFTPRGVGIISEIPPGGLSSSIMIAYAREDWSSAVAPLVVSLQDSGLDVWADQYLPYDSDSWRAAMAQAVEETWLLVFAVTRRALRAPTARAVVSHFVRERKPVISFMLEEETALPAELSRARAIAFKPLNPSSSYHKLIFEIRQHWRARPRA